MTENLKQMLERASRVNLTGEQKEIQRRSFAYGNANIENERVTREIVNQEAEKLVSA
ncbi:hypothetical protein O4H49_03005 [Kiloniella laminariae]|uniref:Uncharacterized protein n=1 Tax=Kiloniella laminariae TaxID=454162 RepID=A0ABT4LIA4_9PROT|nr:hypothetical protein [Kiloniella laminariae]MCZ4279732.1 hypothetical protein [Kiloniella laminariae]